VAKRFPIKPLHPERVCWGCHRYCAADSLLCGNGSERTQHPAELFGEDWQEFGIDAQAGDASATVDAQPPASHRSLDTFDLDQAAEAARFNNRCIANTPLIRADGSMPRSMSLELLP